MIGSTIYDLNRIRDRIALNRMAGRDISQHLGDDDAAIDLVVDHVLSLWKQEEELPEFWRKYCNEVEYAPEGSPNEYREGFGEGNDLDAYYNAVWRARVAELI
jgi:hypothetical protein